MAHRGDLVIDRFDPTWLRQLSLRLMRLITSLLLLPALMASWPAGATVMLKMDLPELVGRADVIFVGKVTKLESRWSEDRRHIVTDTTFQVVQNVRGAVVSRPVVVRSLGGVVGGIGMRVAGSPQFQVGQEALLFTDLRKGHRYVTGMMQGVYLVARDKTGHAEVRGSSAGVTLARRTRSGGLQMVREPAAGPEPLEAFVARVHQTIATCAREKSRCHDR